MGAGRERLLFYFLNLVVTHHPYVSRQGDEVRIFEVFCVGLVRRDRPEQKFAERGGRLRIGLPGRNDRILVVDERIGVGAGGVDQG